MQDSSNVLATLLTVATAKTMDVIQVEKPRFPEWKRFSRNNKPAYIPAPDKNSKHPSSILSGKVSFKRPALSMNGGRPGRKSIPTQHERVVEMRKSRGK